MRQYSDNHDMYYVILLISLLLTLSALAQTRTGSGGVLDDPVLSALPTHEGGSAGVRSGSSEEKIIYVTHALRDRDMVCRSEGHRFLEMKEKDFMETYLKLSILKSTFVADDRCQDVTAYFKCLYSPEVKENIDRILSDKGMKNFLKQKYNMKNKEAREVIKFFKTLDSSCEKNGCKM
jgi:hypothetical protein